MTTADRKRLLVALCACDRVELCLHHFRPAEPQLPFLRHFQRMMPWLGLFHRLFPKRAANSGASLLAPLFQLVTGFFNRNR